MSIVSKFFKTAGAAACVSAAVVGYQAYQRKITDSKLSTTEIRARDNHRYWDQVAATTNVCADWYQSSSVIYSKMPEKLRAIPTTNVDSDTIMAVQKYMAPGLARFSNFDQMQSELPGKVALTIGAALLSAGGSELADGADAVDGLDAIISTADVVDDMDTVVTTTDFAGNAIDMAELTDVADAAQLASITDKLEIAGGLEAVMGQAPNRGLLGISATIRYFKEKKRIPEIKHVVAYRIGRARGTLQKRYGGTFQAINLNSPGPCRR